MLEIGKINPESNIVGNIKAINEIIIAVCCEAETVEIKIGKFPFSASGKASASGTKEGFVKVIFDAKYGEWLGTHMIGYNVTELIAETVTARKLETTYHEVLNAIHPHPTISESIKDAIEVAYGEAIHL